MQVLKLVQQAFLAFKLCVSVCVSAFDISEHNKIKLEELAFVCRLSGSAHINTCRHRVTHKHKYTRVGFLCFMGLDRDTHMHKCKGLYTHMLICTHPPSHTHTHTHTQLFVHASGLRHTGLCWCVLNIWFGLLCFRPPRPGTPETQRKSSVQTSSPAMQSQIKQGNYKEKLAFKIKSRNMKNSARTTKQMLLTKSWNITHTHTRPQTVALRLSEVKSRPSAFCKIFTLSFFVNILKFFLFNVVLYYTFIQSRK